MTHPETREWTHVGDTLILTQPTLSRLLPAARPDYGARCADCDGAGFYLEAVIYGHPNFGKLMPCHCKLAERSERRADALSRLSNLDLFADQTFATFDPDVPGARRAYLCAHDYANDPQGWLLLFGAPGVGKSHLAAAVAHAMLARGEPVLYTVVPDLLDHLRATFGPSSEIAYDARFETVRSTGLLVLDDLGTESATGWAKEKLYQLINHRYNARLPTIITSNRAIETLEPRIVSRMYRRAYGGGPLHIQASDYRRREVRA